MKSITEVMCSGKRVFQRTEEYENSKITRYGLLGRP